MPQAFFVHEHGQLVPRPHARSPWSEEMLHGRLLVGLAAWEIEHHHLDGGLRLTRLTADLFRMGPLVPVRLEAERVRDGKRIRLVDIRIIGGDVILARVSALLVAGGPQPPGQIWEVGPWDLPAPDQLAGSARTPESDAAGFPELRYQGPELHDTSRPTRAWIHDRWPLVENEPLSPIQRAVIASDLANPLSNWSDQGLHYINADLTVHVVRPPEGEWIGLEILDHLHADAVTASQCRLHDALGPFGQCSVVGMAPSGATPPMSMSRP